MKWLPKISILTAMTTALAGAPIAFATGAHAATTRYEAESAPAVCSGAIASNHSGYSGSGFCDTPNTVGSTVQFTVSAPTAGTATLAIRYANGTTTNQPADISVNGTTVQSGLGFEGTGVWNVWATKSLPVQLNAGTTTVRLAATTPGGLPNIDYVEVTTGAGDGSPTDPNIRFVGRWDTRNGTAYVPGWAGAYLKTAFTGTTVKLKQRNTIDLYYSIDGGPDVYLQNMSGAVNLTPTPLAAGNHSLRVSYRVVAGSYRGDAVFQGLVFDPGAHTLPTEPARGMVEFVGDSITVGTTSSKNALTAYGWLVGEQLGLDHMQVAQGGACLVSTADGCVGLDRRFVKVSAVDGAVDHDFTRYQADVVVINLGTNDVGHGVSTAQFQSSYVGLLRTIRGKYPKAAILALKTFRGRYVPETQAAVQTVNNAGDRNVFFVNTDGWVPPDGLSDAVHPNDIGHRAIAAKLAPIVAAHLAPSPTSTSSGTSDSCAVQYKIINQWDGGFQSTNPSENPALAPGASAAVGFTSLWNGVNTAPASFALNDAGCALS
ncbi:GDSL-type esterase/lipase family protein [Nonomuraea sp. NPDC049400]|uniref:GDSL-type esterase/lipase family protein n=1 Tax=Nonomuraea sp. NPDC049400 TaxID=3364352 RepID=UPI00379692CC